MFTKINFALIAVLAVVTAQVSAAEGDYRRVLVYDAGTKPSVAAAKGRYEMRRMHGKTDMCCQKCMMKAATAAAGTKPSVSTRNEAFICAQCDKMVWCDGGHEVSFTEAQDTESMAKIEKTLRGPIASSKRSRQEVIEPENRVDRTTKPSVQTMQARGR